MQAIEPPSGQRETSRCPVADLGCSPNAAVAFDFFVRRGLRDFQAAAIVGNLQWESKLNPRLDVPDPTKSNPGARGRGIAGWGPPRWQNLLAFAAERDPWSLDVQLEFLWHELQSAPSFGLEPLLAATTAADATIVFQDRFEHPDPTKAHADKRIELANAALFACPLVRPPPASPRGGIWAAAAGALALAAATGYGVYKAFTSRALEPGPRPEPRPERRPVLPLPPTFSRRVRPDVDYRDRL